MGCDMVVPIPDGAKHAPSMRQAWAIRWVRECVLVPERFRDHCPDRYHVDAFPSILRGKQKALCAQWYRMLRIPLGSSWIILAFVEVERRHFCGHHVDVLKIFSRKLQYGIGIFTGQSPIGRILGHGAGQGHR